MGIIVNISNYFFSAYEPEENEEIIIQSMKTHYKEIKLKIEQIKITEDIDKKLNLYKDIIKLDNTKEDNILEYLKYIQSLSKNDEKYKKLLISELEVFHIYISEDNYNKYFNKFFKRKKASKKILDFIEIIKNANDLNILKDKKAKLNFLDSFNILLENENKIKFNINKPITWENKELYLYSLYSFLIKSMANIIDFYYDDNSEIRTISKSSEYQYYYNKLQNETDELKKEKLKQYLQTIIFIEGKFFKKYLKNYRAFLENVENNFKAKFGSLELKDKNEQLLLEDYLQFISCYLFDGGENELIIYWKEAFVPLTFLEKQKIFNNFNELNTNCNNKISLENNGTKLQKIIAENEKIEITYLDKYCFYLLTKAFINDIKDDDKDWYLDKYLKPNYYETNLFIYKNNIWKNILINIFKSKTFKDINNNYFFQKKIINYFSIKPVISNILNNIRFFSYKSNFYGSTNEYNYRIYINGIYNYNKNKTISLLIYYAYFIISCLNEIGGRLNMKYQYFFSLDEKFNSLRIQNNFYSEYVLSRTKEYEKTFEKILLGREINALTINEALYILNIKNYQQEAKKFQNNFKNCNFINRSYLIDESLKDILVGLSMEINEIMYGKNILFPIANSPNENKSYNLSSYHPIHFYYQGKVDIQKLINNIKDL